MSYSSSVLFGLELKFVLTASFRLATITVYVRVDEQVYKVKAFFIVGLFLGLPLFLCPVLEIPVILFLLLILLCLPGDRICYSLFQVFHLFIYVLWLFTLLLKSYLFQGGQYGLAFLSHTKIKQYIAFSYQSLFIDGIDFEHLVDHVLGLLKPLTVRLAKLHQAGRHVVKNR